MMVFGGATIAQLFRMVELMNPGRFPKVMILVGTNNISTTSDEEEAQWESMVNDGVPIYYSLAEIQLRGTDRPHCTNEHEDVDSNSEKTQ